VWDRLNNECVIIIIIIESSSSMFCLPTPSQPSRVASQPRAMDLDKCLDILRSRPICEASGEQVRLALSLCRLWW